MNFTDEEREAYEDHLKCLRIEANTLKKQLEKGRVEERIAIARKLLKENMTSEHIANITSLSIEEINKLLK